MEVLSQPGDKILVHTPTYNGFAIDIEGIGRHSVFSALIKDEDGLYRMDYEDMDRKIKENNIHLVMFCSPHNPSGRVWEKWELEKAAEVFEENNCYVISDEIWADLVYPGHQHLPFVNLNEWTKNHVVSLFAPTKTFNLAGITGSYHIIYNDELRRRITDYGNSSHYNTLHLLSMHALIGAYSDESADWLGELLEVLEKNCQYKCNFNNEKIEGVQVTLPQGTYMLFLECKDYLEKTGMSLDELVQKGWDYEVAWANGKIYNGLTNIRLNLALPFERVEEACRRMEKYIF